MSLYYIVGFIALIILYKVFDERGTSWAYIFMLIVFGALGFYNGRFVFMYDMGIIQFLVEIFLILIITFIYNKFMYLLFNTMSIAAVFLISSLGCSCLFNLGVIKLYPIILDYALELVYKIL